MVTIPPTASAIVVVVVVVVVAVIVIVVVIVVIIAYNPPSASSPSPLLFPLCLLIVVSSVGQSRCYRRWCRRCHHGRPLSLVAFVVPPRPLSPLPMADLISSPLPSQPVLQGHRRRRKFLPSLSQRCRRWDNAQSPSLPHRWGRCRRSFARQIKLLRMKQYTVKCLTDLITLLTREPLLLGFA